MVAWLNKLLDRHTGDPVSHFAVCMDMHRASKSDMMKKLLEKEKLQVQRQACEGLPPGKSGCFASARHSIGRLAARVGKPCALLLQAPLMVEVLKNHEVKFVKKLLSPKRPDNDGQTTVDGILRRMLPADKQSELGELKQRLEAMQQDNRLLNRYMDNYRLCKPTFVHSEISVLEHFFSQGLTFLDDDRYVYSSKPACFCCKLYFTHHPARMVIPESHGKVYLNWGPPQIGNFNPKDAPSIRQRDLMNKIIQDVRGKVLDQLWSRRYPHGGHPDSTTGVPSVAPSQDALHGWHNAIQVATLPFGSPGLSAFDYGHAPSATQGLQLAEDPSFTGNIMSSSDMTGPEQRIPESSDDDDADDEDDDDEEGGVPV